MTSPTTLLTPLVLAGLKPRAREYTIRDARCAGLALRVQPSGARSWVCWHRTDGKTRRITLGRFEDLSVEDARAAYRAFQNTLDNPDAYTSALPVIKSRLRFEQLCSEFITAKTGIYAKSTLSSLGHYLSAQLLPAFGHRLVSEIMPSEIAAWFHEYSKTRPGGANQALGHIHTIFNWARQTGRLPTGFRDPTGPIKRSRRRPRGQMLNSEDITRLFAVLDTLGARYQAAADAIRLILLTGCRSGEILRLQWRDVKQDRLRLRRTKTGPRDVLLSKAAMRHLEGMRTSRRTHAHPASPYLFPARHSKYPYRTSIDHAWRSIKTLANLPSNLRLHDLRHTYASHALLCGETLFMTGKLLGHKSPDSTSRYAHLEPTLLSDAAERISGEIAERLGAGVE